MSRSITYIFPASNPTDVCKSQTLAGAGNLVLNGNLANQTNSAVSFTDYGYIRSVTISSTNNLSARTFTINGTQNGVSISENLAGPTAANPVQTVNCFDSITSISVDGAAADIRVGSGYFGFFKLIGINLEHDVIDYSFSIAKLSALSIETTIYASIKDISLNGKTFMDIVANDWNVHIVKNTSIENQYFFPTAGLSIKPLYRNILIAVEGEVGTQINSLELNFIQT